MRIDLRHLRKHQFQVDSLVLATILALALLVRSWDLLSLPLFTDEAIYLHWAKTIHELHTRVALLIPIKEDGKQPLFMWLAAGAMVFHQDPLVAGRMVSVVAGLFSTFGMYLAGYWLAGRHVGQVAALLYAVSPFTVIFDRMALVDGPLCTATVWSLAIGIFMMTRARGGLQMGAAAVAQGIVLGAAIWTKMTALLILPVPVLCTLLIPCSRALTRWPYLAIGYVVFGLFASLLAMAPEAENLIEKTSHFSLPLSSLIPPPLDLWKSNLADYWSWIQTYLPAPLHWLVLLSVLWGLINNRRHTLTLICCWAVLALPTMLTAQLLYTTRYVVSSVVPLLLLTSESLVAITGRLTAWSGFPTPSARTRSLFQRGAGIVGLLLVLLPSVSFSSRLITNPESAGLCSTDQGQYVNGWPSGYGFAEAIDLVRHRVAEHDGAVIVLSDHYRGLPYDGIAIYLKDLPGVHHYVDGHLIWNARGILDAWRSHNVPLLLIGNDGRDDLESFEREVPEAERLGVFWKPGGKYSFRVYEIDLPSR